MIATLIGLSGDESDESVKQIAQEILKRTGTDKNSPFGYGWVKIRDEVHDLHETPDTVPLPWDLR